MTKAAVDYGSTNTSKSRMQVRGKRFRIGVLPFLPHRVPDDEDFAITLSEAIAAELARCSLWEVISPESLMDRTAISLTEDGEKQGGQLDYVLEGVVSTDDKRAHLNIRLLDLGECARTVWSERTIINIGRLRRWSRLAALQITGGVDPVTLFFERRPTPRSRTGANGLLFIAIPLMSTLERRKYEEAGRLISRAVEIEPDKAQWLPFGRHFGKLSISDRVGPRISSRPGRSPRIVHEERSRSSRTTPRRWRSAARSGAATRPGAGVSLAVERVDILLCR